ncbi:bifunctional shikimate kinase/3-dehydroquinate synthase [soil metagenome]
MMQPQRIVLIGPSGSGKSHLGSLLAEALERDFVDLDAEIESRIGMPIDEFFARFGQPAFRAIESEMLGDACSRMGTVVATGGGAVLAPRNWASMRPGSVIIGLTAGVETLVDRVERQAARLGRSAVRPNMAGDPHRRMREMLDAREKFYAQADVIIDTEGQSIDDVLEVALAAVEVRAKQQLIPSLSIESSIERSDLYVGRGTRRGLPALVSQRWPAAGKLWIISDDRVASHWLEDVAEPLMSSGYAVRTIIVPAGEASKSLDQLGSILVEMTAAGVSRTDVVVALGGGVVGDLAGFAAAVCLRGLSLVQLPTSLLAMVDSSVGGKTAINTPSGKNMVGAFYQPGLVLIDTEFLSTLAAEEYRSGMSEVIKHSLIQPSTPLGSGELASILEALPSLEPIDETRVDEVVLQNVMTKHSVVQEDERESGLRMILNFGHTAGHAIEADGYRYRHGEAVGLGMLVATHIAIALDLCAADRYLELQQILDRAGLPTRYEGNVSTVIENMKADKKNLSGVQRWILPVGRQGVEVRTGIEPEIITEALGAIGAR